MDAVERAREALPTRSELDAAQDWLWSHPPGSVTRAQRLEKMSVLQAAADRLSPETYAEYDRAGQEDPRRAGEWEDQGILHSLGRATARALTAIQTTEVSAGLAVWHIYNMGYVFKTRDLCFGIDLHLRQGAELANALDFLLVTHEHADHFSPDLLEAMLARKKPVVTRWYPGSTVIAAPTALQFGPAHVKIDIGDHHRTELGQRDNMLMFQVDCGGAAPGCTIYHSGDGNNYEKMRPDREIDLFMLHVRVGMDVAEAIRSLRPRRTLGSHVLELGHSRFPPQAWRWSFACAYEQIRDFPEEQASVLTWGERLLIDGR